MSKSKRCIPGRRGVSWILLVFGVLVSIVGFYLSAVENVGWLSKLFRPDYHNARAALTKLEADQELKNGDPGCEEIEKILKTHLATFPENSDKLHIINEGSLMKLSTRMGRSTLSYGGMRVLLAGFFRYGDQDIHLKDIDIEVLRSGVLALSTRKIWRGSAILFWLGIAIVILSKAVDGMTSR